jgi:dephospho-CoA kinase
MIIGLTGSPGAGKSLVAEYMKEKGAVVISGDEVGRRVLEKNPRVLRKLARIFGSDVLKADGGLDRKKLGKLVFSDSAAMRRFNEIMHPPLLRILKDEIDRHVGKGDSLIVVDAALILEWGIENWFDHILVVTARRDKRIERLRRSGLTVKEARDRIASQISQREKAAGADFVLENNGSKAALRKKVFNFMNAAGITGK